MVVAILVYNTALTSILTLSIACAYYLYTREGHRIFAILVIAIGTVKTHIHNVYHKTGVTKRGQLMAKCQDFSESYGGEILSKAEETG